MKKNSLKLIIVVFIISFLYTGLIYLKPPGLNSLAIDASPTFYTEVDGFDNLYLGNSTTTGETSELK